MRILLAASEVVPFAKTGGLADVAGALPVELARLGHEPIVMLPAYRTAFESGQPIRPANVHFQIPIGNKIVSGELLESRLPGANVPVYLVRQDHYYDRAGLYFENGVDYIDNCERFVFFCRAVMETIRLLNLSIDVLHANDWPTGLLPAYLKTEYQGAPGYENIVSLFTIHNLAYQGQFWHWDMLLTGLDWKYFNWRQMEYFGQLNLMKTGLVFADALNTVSPRYAEEIRSAPLGCGLEGVLQQRRDVLTGIINGVDYSVWNPETDTHIARTYNVDTVNEGKAACKAALQKELGLPAEPKTPLVGLISRLVDQKGFDLVTSVMPQWAQNSNLQWVILGSGDAKYEEALARLRDRFPHRVAVRLEYSETLAHRIEAGADMFLMPSRYEPCGLNQLYSLKYGTVPVVRATGGLADTVVDATDDAVASGSATGFSFREYSPLALNETLERAVNVYNNQPQIWAKIRDTGMRQDWSWARSAREYVQLYQDTIARARGKIAQNAS